MTFLAMMAALAAWETSRRVPSGASRQLKKLLEMYDVGMEDDDTWEAALRLTAAAQLELQLAELMQAGLDSLRWSCLHTDDTGYFSTPILVEENGQPLGFLVHSKFFGRDGVVQLWHPESVLWWLLYVKEEGRIEPIWANAVRGNVIEDDQEVLAAALRSRAWPKCPDTGQEMPRVLFDFDDEPITVLSP
jgi:hypothetical protein